MLTKRIIPCLDVKNSRTVKGIKFENMCDAGDPVELASLYVADGADELVFLDITASEEKRKTLKELVKEVARNINIPFTVGGGIGSINDVGILLEAGADKVSVNSSAIENPNIIGDMAKEFGSQCIVAAMDARVVSDEWIVFSRGGKRQTHKNLFSWAKECQERGAGEILFTSIDHDGTKSGFANDALRAMNELLNIPVIASGGAGSVEHFKEAFIHGKADAALAASVFHFGDISVSELKKFLKRCQILMR